MDTFIRKENDWESILKDKYVLLDANSIIYIDEAKAYDFLDFMETTLGVTLCYITPVYLELHNTNNKADLISRKQILTRFELLVITPEDHNKTANLQNELAIYDCRPQIVDLYLGAVLKRLQPNLYLLTSNVKDFPEPIYTRESGIIIQRQTTSRVLSIVK